MEMGSGSVTESGGSSTNSSTESSSLGNGLRFGQKIYFEDAGGGSGPGSSSGSSGSGRRGRGRGRGGGSGQSGQPPRCQVEGCRVDLSNAKAYYYRHRVCGMHSKSPTVTVAGLEQRFCQQCSRFHLLPEFDQGKRSCRRRLAGHNERRRKPQPGSLLSSRYGRLSSSVFGNNTAIGGSFLTSPMRWPPGRSSEHITELHTRRSLPTPPWQINSENPLPDIFQQSVTGFSCPGIIPGVESYKGVTDSSCALSLLSNQQAPPAEQQIWSSSTRSSSSFNLMNTGSVYVAQPGPVSTHHYQNQSWVFNGDDDNNTAGTNTLSPVLVLGQISDPVIAGAADGGGFPFSQHQESRRLYMEPDDTRAYDSSSTRHINWSL